jgi:hypothetical protein
MDKMRSIIAVAFLASALVGAQAQTPANEAAPGMPGIGLTPKQKRIIYENTSSDRPQRVAEDVSVGKEIPDSVILNEMPIHVKDEVGVLRDFKFAVLQEARSVLIVDPANRKIVDIVTRDDAK